MKKIKQLGTLAFLALALTFGSCSSDSDGGSTSAAGDGTISAKVDGKTVTTIKAGTVGVVNSNGDFKMLTLTGSSMSGQAISITVFDFNGNGTYNLITDDGPSVSFTYTALDFNDPQNTNNVWVAPGGDMTGTTGTLTVTESSTERVKGTFSFKGVNNLGTFKDVKSGSFNVSLNQQGQ